MAKQRRYRWQGFGKQAARPAAPKRSSTRAPDERVWEALPATAADLQRDLGLRMQEVSASLSRLKVARRATRRGKQWMPAGAPSKPAPVTRRVEPEPGAWWLTVGSGRCSECREEVGEVLYYRHTDQRRLCALCAEDEGVVRSARPSKAFRTAVVRGEVVAR